METIYPAGPTQVPAQFTKASKLYRQRAWLALGMLLLFMLLYFSLAGWFVWTAWRLISAAAQGGGDAFLGWITGAVAAFFAVFMLKALFFVQRGQREGDVEVTKQEQPQLFAFLYKLADETGAPRPHRVYLSPRVNAAVFYDLSILNLLFPSRKNLEIGLGLVNVLNISEFKAVCAHEFGHFAQKTMAVGRWVYIAQQIASHIVNKRDAFDRFLEGLSRIDLRLAWIGWLLRLIVWALRSLLDTAFTLVVLAERSLSREMEMQADRVAVALSGSDALIHALYKLQAADDAWGRSLRFMDGEVRQKRAPLDVFAIQTAIIERMGVLLNIREYGQAPAIPENNPQQHRLFKAEIAQPPQMWLSHPLNHEREENAKQQYLAASQDERSAWLLFEAAAPLREKVSSSLYLGKTVETYPVAEAIAQLDRDFSQESLKREYRGVYYGRSAFRHADSASALYSKQEGAASWLDKLYPEKLSDQLEQLSSLEKEKTLLENVQSGYMRAAGGVVNHRGKRLKKRQLAQAITVVAQEIKQLQDELTNHDRRCRTAHRAAAQLLGQGWDNYLQGLASVIHYADHSRANLLDASRSLQNQISVAMATGRVNQNDRARVISKAKTLYVVLKDVFTQAPQLHLDSALSSRMGLTQSWADNLGEYELNPPSDDNIASWLDVVNSWIGHAAGHLQALSDHALDELLQSEARVGDWYRHQQAADLAPAPSQVPQSYAVLLPGQERELQTKLGWWARFLNAEGFFPASLRLLVALGIVGAVLGVSSSVGESKLMVYNGLENTVQIKVGERQFELKPHVRQSLDFPPGQDFQITARTQKGQLIEQFPVTLESGFQTYVYNVAEASPLIESIVIYGSSSAPPPDQVLGTPRWSRTNADDIFQEPPASMSARQGEVPTRKVLSAPDNITPSDRLKQVLSTKDYVSLVSAHARWDRAESADLAAWLQLASSLPGYDQLLADRLHDDPEDKAALKAQQQKGNAAP